MDEARSLGTGLGLWAVLSIVWFYAILRWVKHTDPEEHVPTLGKG